MHNMILVLEFLVATERHQSLHELSLQQVIRQFLRREWVEAGTGWFWGEVNGVDSPNSRIHP